ncbi:MAG: methionyl-tRNA formyltransferase [Clostridia bacterium]|nr:methionyl-tRNA formyltransferase [Clostridia bacterium]
MKILFMGTGAFAEVSLKALIDAGRNVVAVVSQPNKPKNRGMKIIPTPVAVVADENNIDLYAPKTLKDGALLPVLEEKQPDLIVVVAYGKLLPKYVLEFPKYGCINIHGSLLPKYRGAAPIQWSIINGEKITGVTSMYLAEGMDTGDMILKREMPIAPDDTYGTLHDKLAVLGGELLIETVELIENGKVKAEKQDESLATYAPMLSKSMGGIDWSKTAEEIVNQVRGMNPWPCAYSENKGKRFKVYSASVTPNCGTAGEVLLCDGQLIVAAGEGSVQISELQPDNKKRMKTEDFLRGNKTFFTKGDILRG